MSSKKKQKDVKNPLWTECTRCPYLIPQKKVGSPCKGLGIRENIFYTDRIHTNVPADLENIQSSYSERFILFPYTIALVCSFTMNSNVIIEINETQKYVRSAWTIENPKDKDIDHVHSPSKELQKEQEEQYNMPIVIRRYTGIPKKAFKIVFECMQTLEDVKELERLIRSKIKNTIIHRSNIVIIPFLNQTFEFEIKSIESPQPRELADQIAELNLDNDQFYFVEPITDIKIDHKVNKPPNLVYDKYTLDNMGGLEDIYEELIAKIRYSFSPHTNKSPSRVFRGVLLYGLPGCGKSLLSEVAAKSCKLAKVTRIEPWKIFSKYHGESEANLRKIFDNAYLTFPSPHVIIIDEIANICPKNDSSDVVRKVSSLLISLIESVHDRVKENKLFIIATTNNLDNVDPALRRSGRLDYEVEIPVPNTIMRREILRKMVRQHQITEETLDALAKLTHGYVGADLEKLIEKSKKVEHDTIHLTSNDIFANLSSVKPSAMRELLVEKPNVKWGDIGGMHDVKRKLQQIIDWPINNPAAFQRLGITPPSGLLMFGAPGCSKTMIAKAVATESNINFISIKGSDLFSMWVGESEKAVRDLFVKARQLAPCIIFFDEIDAIGSERESGSGVKERVLAQILTEIDGVNVLKNVIIIAATNRPDLIDTALMRPGRLDRIVYVKLPDWNSRREIFEIKLKKIPVAEDVNVEELVNKTEGYSGAEIEAVCKEAALNALEKSLNVKEIAMSCFMHALDVVKPRTSPELLEIYKNYENGKK